MRKIVSRKKVGHWIKNKCSDFNLYVQEDKYMKRKEAIKKATERWSRWCSKYADEALFKIIVTLIFYILVAIIYPEHYK